VPAPWWLSDLLGELGCLAGEELAELLPELIVCDVEEPEDLRAGAVLVCAEREQKVLGRGDRAAVTEAAGLVSRRFEYALGPG
jgi:hypothetical protein